MIGVLRRLLPAVLILELLICGWMVRSRLLRRVPSLPVAFPDDPLFAAEVMSLARRAEDGGAEDWLQLGRALLSQGFYVHAESALDRALDLDADRVDARFALAFALDRTGRLAESNVQYQRCVDTPADDRMDRLTRMVAAYAIGLNHLRAEDVTAAERWFRENKEVPQAQFQLAKLLHATGRSAEAAELVASLLTVLPLSLELHHLNAQVLEAIGRPAEAFAAGMMEERSRRAIELSFQNEYISSFGGFHGIKRIVEECHQLDPSTNGPALSRRLDRIDACMTDRLVPERKVSLLLRADVAIATGNTARVKEIVGLFGANGISDASLLELEAAARGLEGDAQAAISLRRRAAAMGPTPLLHLQLANDFRDLGDAEASARQQAAFHRLEGLTVFRRNRLDDALAELKKSLELDPVNPATWFHVGEVEYHLSRLDRADDAMRRAVELRPGYGRAIDFLGRTPP